MAYEGERPHQDAWAAKKLRVGGPYALAEYQAEKNAIEHRRPAGAAPLSSARSFFAGSRNLRRFLCVYLGRALLPPCLSRHAAKRLRRRTEEAAERMAAARADFDDRAAAASRPCSAGTIAPSCSGSRGAGADRRTTPRTRSSGRWRSTCGGSTRSTRRRSSPGSRWSIRQRGAWRSAARVVGSPLEENDLTDRLPAPGAAVDERVERDERVARSLEALARIKPDERTALLLKAEGFSYHEIGERLGWTYTKVNRAITEGRRRFLGVVANIESGAECERFAPMLMALVRGGADAEDLIALRPHLRHCAGCRATVRELHASRRHRLAFHLPFVAGIAPTRWLGDRLADAPSPSPRSTAFFSACPDRTSRQVSSWLRAAAAAARPSRRFSAFASAVARGPTASPPARSRIRRGWCASPTRRRSSAATSVRSVRRKAPRSRLSHRPRRSPMPSRDDLSRPSRPRVHSPLSRAPARGTSRQNGPTRKRSSASSRRPVPPIPARPPRPRRRRPRFRLRPRKVEVPRRARRRRRRAEGSSCREGRDRLGFDHRRALRHRCARRRGYL